MPVPDETYFGNDENGTGVNYGLVRRETNAVRRMQLLEHRLRVLLVGQIDELWAPPNSPRKVYSPFPLAVLTCVAIETLGRVFYLNDSKQAEKLQSYCFVSVVNHFDKQFSRPMDKQFKALLKKRFPEEQLEASRTLSQLLHSYFRNTFVHGYRGRGVYLEEAVTSWVRGDGFLVVNPNWFWCRFKQVFGEHFLELYANKEANNPFMVSASAYLTELLK